MVVLLIALYQRTLSPDHGPLKHLHPYGYCRHHPTCSEYGKKTLEERGLILGIILLSWRLLSCHPWKEPSDEKLYKIIESASQK